MSGQYNVKLRLLAGFGHLLVPLIRVLLRNGIAFHEFAEVVKSTYARVCAMEFGVPDRRMTNSRVAIMTGLTRKEVAKIFAGEDHLEKILDNNVHRIARVLQGWHTDKDFIGPYGVPRELHVDNDPSGAPTFGDLVRRYSGDMPARAMLDELLRSKAVARADEKNVIRAERRSYIPDGLAPEVIEVFARSVRRYIDTIDNNNSVSDPKLKRFERHVFPDEGICAEDWERFRVFVKERLEPVLEDLDTKFAWFPSPAATGKKAMSVGVGVFVYCDDPAEQRKLAQLMANDEAVEKGLLEFESSATK
jgi:hypothetical protein